MNKSVHNCASLTNADHPVLPDFARMVISSSDWQTLASAQ